MLFFFYILGKSNKIRSQVFRLGFLTDSRCCNKCLAVFLIDIHILMHSSSFESNRITYVPAGLFLSMNNLTYLYEGRTRLLEV